MRRRALATLTIALTVLAVSAVPAAAARKGRPAAATADPLWSQQWGPRQINAEQAWATSTGTGQVIAIVDSGIDLTHPDLRNKIVGGATFVDCADRPAGCGNGDWAGIEPHGTHVAGIAAASTGNGVGIAGVARDANLLAVRVLGPDGGTFEEIAAGIRWSVDNGADVVNLSLGALPGVQALEITGLIADAKEAIAYAAANDVVVVAAAGNETAPLCGSPGFSAGALCVTSTDRNELPSYFSNQGVKPDLHAVAAPGGQGLLFCDEDVVSTVPASAEGSCGEGSGYDYYAGTSMATPHVAGVAALLTAQGRSAAEVFDVLESTARTPGGAARGVYTTNYGWGIVDAAAAVAAA